MARPPRRSDGDKQQRRRRRRLYILSNHDGSAAVSIYKLNENDLDSDDAYSEDADDGSCSTCSSESESEGRVDYFAAQDRFDSEYDVDSRARPLRHRRLVARLATPGCPEFVAAGTKIVGVDSSSSYRAKAANFIFDARTRLVSATPPLRSPKKYDKFWAIGGTVYALDTSAADDQSKQRCVFERLGPEPLRHHGTWQWEALPAPPFNLDHIVVSHAVHPDGATVFLSVHKTGTFSVDAERLEWARHGHGDWALPFDGEGYYVRDLDAWVGLCSRHPGRLAACRVVDDRRGGAEPACKCGRDLLFRQAWRRHESASLVYMGNASFCLLETVLLPHLDRSDACGMIVPMLLRVVTFRVHCSWDGELCVVNRRAKVYKLPWQPSSDKPRAFWI